MKRIIKILLKHGLKQIGTIDVLGKIMKYVSELQNKIKLIRKDINDIDKRLNTIADNLEYLSNDSVNIESELDNVFKIARLNGKEE